MEKKLNKQSKISKKSQTVQFVKIQEYIKTFPTQAAKHNKSVSSGNFEKLRNTNCNIGSDHHKKNQKFNK